MTQTYLEVTYRRGRPFAAYLQLGHRDGDTAARVEQASPTVNIDFAADGQAIGVELLDPAAVTLADLNRLLAERNVPAVAAADLAPLAPS